MNILSKMFYFSIGFILGLIVLYGLVLLGIVLYNLVEIVFT